MRRQGEIGKYLFWTFMCAAGVLGLFIAFPLIGLYLRSSPLLLAEAFSRSYVWKALRLTLFTSTIATGLAIFLGVPTAFVLARGSFKGRDLLDTIVTLPMTLPPMVIGVALLLFLGRQGLVGQYFTSLGVGISFTTVAVIIAQFVVASPYFIQTTKAGLQAVPSNLEAASLSLGASPARTFFKVTLPLCRNSLIAGLALTWARAVGEFGATLMFAGNWPGRTQTAPLAILTTMCTGDVPAACALSVILLTVSLCVFLGTRLLFRVAGSSSSGSV